MDRRHFLYLTAAASGTALWAQRPQRPNIIFILADDLGYGDLGCYGQRQIRTPSIDQLASEGMRFTQAYAGAAVCAPSRCCLMTGFDTGHSRIRGNFGVGATRVSLRPDDVIVAEVLKTAGYRTGIFGKWGLGEAGTLGIPNDQGFDEWFGFLNQDDALHYYPESIWDNRTEVFPPGNQGAKRKQYAPDLFTEHALSFLDHSANRPFFLYLPYTLPHADSELARDTGDGYVVPSYGPYSNKPWQAADKGYAAMISGLDRDVGRVVQRVKQLGIEQNTLIIFASDNGPAKEGTHKPGFFSSAGNLRGMKATLYEGGIRIPMIARWPGRIKAGQVNDEMLAFWDFLPTAAELAGVPYPEGLDGVSFAPTLFGKIAPRKRYFYWESHEKGFSQAIRIGKWKAIRNGGQGKAAELYDLERDPSEAHDVAGENSAIVVRLVKSMSDARTDAPEYPVSTSILIGQDTLAACPEVCSCDVDQEANDAQNGRTG